MYILCIISIYCGFYGLEFELKYLLTLLLLFPSLSYADRSLELLGGGITYHVLDYGASSKYSNKISNDGRLIYTPMLGLRITNIPGNYSYSSAAIFRGTSSIGSPIYGGLLSSGLAISVFQVGFGFGGYIQNNEDFRAKGIQPYSFIGNTNALVPLVGIEANVRYPLSDKLFLAFNNLLTPVITNHYLSLGLKYE